MPFEVPLPPAKVLLPDQASIAGPVRLAHRGSRNAFPAIETSPAEPDARWGLFATLAFIMFIPRNGSIACLAPQAGQGAWPWRKP